MSKADVNISSGTATLDDVVKEAKIIWKEIKTDTSRDEVECKKLVTELYKAHPDFCRTFPVVVEYSVCNNEFNFTVFKEYLKYYNIKARNVEKRSMDDFYALQAEYLVLVEKNKHAHMSPQDVARFRQYYIDVIRKSAEEDKARIERLTEEAKKLDAEEIEKIRESIKLKLANSK